MIERTEAEIMKSWGETDCAPLVSVVCCTYNHEKYIVDALEGFLSQRTKFAFEVLVNDDASTDHTGDILRDYASRFPKIIKPLFHEINEYSQGIDVFSNVVTGAKGAYIAICEGDDYWIDEDKLQMQVIGDMKGKSAMYVARRYGERQKYFNGQHMWVRGYFISTVGLD